ncbi:hypothetical protein GCK32_004085 [Trichostrongylus colubriformis]|uniref:Uncharacterized protein n=1 Tax=Trichostrongylus colubriformis TaxID=6319 RepID=A0AAN8IM57_TRICO
MDLSEDDNIIPTDIPINTLNNIADILRTPKARACAAAHAESQRKWTDRTPEAEPERPAPRSILKSAKTERGTQPRSRLRFDLSPAPLSSTGQQTVSSATSSPEVLGRMAQPNFDESLEYGDDTTNSEDGAVEVQDEPFVPLVSPDPNEDVMPEEEPLYNSPASQDNDDVLEHSMEVQDEEDTEEGQEPATNIPPPLVEEEQDDDEYAVCVEEQPDIDEPSHREETSLSKHIEKQDETMANGSCIVSVQESNDEVEKEGAMEVEGLEVENSVEVQEEAHEANNVIHVTRSDSAVNASISPPRSSPSLPSSVVEVASGPVADEQAAVETQSEFDGAVSDQCVDDVDIAIERQSDMDEEAAIERQSDDLEFGDHETAVGGDKNSHELQEDVMDATFTLPDATFTLPAPSCLANGDFVSLVAESVTTVAEDRTDEICDVKLVDYSFTSDSTFDRTHTPKKLQKAPDTADHSLIRKTLEFDRAIDSMFDPDQLVHPIVDECSSETQSSPRLPSSPAEFVTKSDSQGMASPKGTAGATPEIVEPAAATPSPPPHMSDSDVVPASTRRSTRSSAKKGARAAPPATPTRQSRRLRNRSVSVDDENSEKGSDVTSVVSKSPPPSNDDESTTSHLTMSSRRTTRKTSNSSAAAAPIVERVSLTMSYRLAKEKKHQELGTPSKTESKIIASSSATRRSLRKRTPSQAQQEQHPSAASVKSSRRSRKLNESVEETEQKPTEVVQKSPGRGGRTRKVSTASSEASSSVPKSPTRRTPTRSMTKSKPVDVEQQGSKRKGTLPKAARALSEKFTIPKQLGGMDAATLFDMTMEGKSFRRRSLSDSAVPEVKAKRSRTQIVDTIAEAAEEPGSVASERSEAVNTEDVFDAPQPSAVEEIRTPTRQRRAASATPAELTPSRTTAQKEPKSPSRKHSMASSDEPTSSATKSPSRRTPTRSMTKSKLLEVEQTSSKYKGSRSKAVRALSEKISIPKPLGGIDARTFFDMSMSDTSTRNRTLSDSVVHEVEEKRTRTNKIVGAIMEVDEGSGSISSRSSGDKSASSVQEMSAAENMQSSSRTRRAKSATPVDLTPTRMRTRKASDSLIPNTSETPKSPSRRGRSSKIQTIPE